MMKRLFSFIITIAVLAALGVFLITENPNADDFSKWYVKNNPTEMGSFFDEVYEALVEQETASKDYVLFSVFEIKNAKYVGIAGHFWGKDSVEKAKENASNIIEQARQKLEDSLPNG